MELDAIDFQRKSGQEEIIAAGKNRKLLDFWSWAYSDLVSNTDRGSIAEYLVAIACDIEDNPRISWNAYDLLTKDGIKIEVKSSGYLQTWKQKDYSRPIFGIPKTLAWDYKNNVYEIDRKRQADVYVFALHAHKDKATINSLDTHQWEFYILSSRVLDEKVRNSKNISLKKILELGGRRCTFDEIFTTIKSAISNEFKQDIPL